MAADPSIAATASPPSGASSSAVDRPGGRSRLAAGDRRFGFAFGMPATLIVLVLIGGPALQTILYSFQKVSPINANELFARPFVGFDNYAKVLSSPNFQNSLWVTLQYAAGFLLLSTGLGLLFALLLHEPLRFRWLGRTLLILPWAAPWLMVGIMWKWFIDADVGALNGILYQFGLINEYIPFLADPRMALLFTIIAAAWRQASLTGLLFLAGLQTIPTELPEAAKVDGASAWGRFRYVTLPWLRPVLLVVLITNTILGFLQFDVIFIMTQGGPGTATNLLSMYLYRLLFNFSDYGLGSAVAVILGLMTFSVGLVFVRFLYRSESTLGRAQGEAA